MKKTILKLFGYSECCKCKKLFSKYGGSKVVCITLEYLYSDKIEIKEMFFCHEHRVNFFLALNGLANDGTKFEDTLTFRKLAKGSSNFFPIFMNQPNDELEIN